MERKGLQELGICLCVILLFATFIGYASLQEPSVGDDLEFEEVVIKVAHVYPDTQVEGKAALKFKEYVENSTDGRVKVEVFPASQLGSQQALIELRQQGAIQIDLHGMACRPQYDAFYLPYIFNDAEHMQKVLDSDFAKKWLEDYINTTGGRILGIYSRGFRNLVLKNEARNLNDLSGIKIRVPELPALVAMCNAWGAIPTPVAWPETYNAILLGTVDGAENTLSLIYNQKFYEVAHYVLMTEHSISPVFWIINNENFTNYSEPLQEVIQEGVKMAIDFAIEQNKIEEGSFIESLKNKGVEVIKPENLDQFRDGVRAKIADLVLNYWSQSEYEKVIELGQ